jgi:Carboxypeptidase regulatory-like domain/TonB dependent receptor
VKQFASSLLLVVVCLLFASTAAWSQTSTSLRGTVTDQSGAVVAAAKVILTNTDTGISRDTITGSDGGYVFDLLPVGTYKVTVEKAGFATFVQTGIKLELNQFGRLDVTLKVGQTSQVVEVSSNVAQVDTTSAVLGKVEDQRMINDLPLSGRDTLQLGLPQAGVFAPDPDDGSGNPFSVSGQRSESLTFLLDGGLNSDFLGNRIVVSPNPDAVQEFKILTNNYDAEYGRTSGGIVNQITKAGTNSFHGDLFEFNRNDLFNARDYFLPAGLPKQAFKRNVFGGTIGGPIKKDKTFFFLAYQGWRSREGQTSPILTVLDGPERVGNFGELCATYDSSGNCTDPNGTQLVNPINGNNIPNNNLANAGLVNPVIQNYINKYLPMANIGTNEFVSSPTAAINQDQGVLHVDHYIGSRDTLSFVYVINDLRDAFPFHINHGASTGGDVPLGSGFTDTNRGQIGTFTWTHTFPGGKVNEFRFAANRFASRQAIPDDTTTPAQLGFTNVNPDDPLGAAPPVIFTNGFNLGPSPQGPTTLNRATFEWADNYTWTHGKHEFKFGGDAARIRQNFRFDFFNNGSFDFTFGNFTGNEVADFVGGFWDNYFQFSKAIYGIRTSSFGLYAQDTWKVLPRLTLSLGLRWDYFTPQTDVHNEILGFFPNSQSTVFPNAPPDILYPGDPGTPNRALVYPDYRNFAPRFGFAWDIFGTAKLVMRGGFGLFYDIEDGALNLQFGGQAPFGDVVNPFPSSFTGVTGDPVADPFNAAGIPNPFPFTQIGTFFTPKIGFAFTTWPHFRTPYSENFNYGFQYQLAKDTMIEAVYVGSLGRRLISSGEVNFPSPTIEQQQLAQFGFVNPDCARVAIDGSNIAQCTGGSSAFDPNGSPNGATQLITDFSNGFSHSNEFQLTVDKRFSKRFAFRVAYTVSKTIDLTSGFRARSGEYTDPLNHNLDRGLADFDTPQRLVISGIWGLPFDRGIHSNGFLKKAAEGWQLNNIASFQKGNPITFYSNSNSSEQNNFLDRPNLVGPIPHANPRNANQTFTSDCLGGSSTGNFWIDPTNLVCSACPVSDPTCSVAGDVGVPLFTFGTYPRNAIRGPGINNWDISITKTTPITESKSIEFRAESFNTFNHVQFETIGDKGGNSTFGQVTQDRPIGSGGPRVLQFGLKFYF